MHLDQSSAPEIETRPYQDVVIDKIFRAFISHLEANNLLTKKSKSKLRLSELAEHIKNKARMLDDPKRRVSHLVDQSALIDQSMGSGKTLVLAKILERIMLFRDQYMHDKPLRVLIVTDRISTVDQLQSDFMTGRGIETAPLLSERVRGSIRDTINHSQSNQNIAHGFSEVSEIDDQKKDEVIFSTIHSADKLTETGAFDIIIVDEADASLRTDGEYLPILEQLAEKSSIEGVKPFIIGATGTADRETENIFGPARATYTLTEYLMSGYAPDISYHLMTHPNVTEDELGSLHSEILRIQQYGDIAKKRKGLKEFRTKLDTILLRMHGYDELARHMSAHIDLTKKTVVFTPSIRDAEELTEALNRIDGMSGKVIAIHSDSSETDSAILSRFRDRDNPLSVLTGVDKLNRGIDLPECANIVFLRDTGSKRIFSQQLARGLRGEETAIYDYVVNLSNLVYLYDVQERGARRNGAYGKTGGKGSSQIRLFFGGQPIGEGTDASSTREVNFYDLCGLYLDTHRQYDIVELGTTPEMVRETLTGYGVVDYETLMSFGVYKFSSIFGRSDIGIILKKKIHYIYPDDLYNLAMWIGWSIPKEAPKKTKELGTDPSIVRKKLAEYGITDTESLREFGPKKFMKNFGRPNLRKRILQNTGNRYLKLDDLDSLAQWLGWEIKPRKQIRITKKGVLSLGENSVTIIHTLAKYNIIDYTTLLEFGPVKFRKTFGVSDIKKILTISSSHGNISTDSLYALAIFLGWEVPEKKPSETTGQKIILGDLPETVSKTLAQYEIIDYETLMRFGITQFNTIFGRISVGKILGKKKKHISTEDLNDLAVWLGWEVPEKRPSEDSKKR